MLRTMELVKLGILRQMIPDYSGGFEAITGMEKEKNGRS